MTRGPREELDPACSSPCRVNLFVDAGEAVLQRRSGKGSPRPVDRDERQRSNAAQARTRLRRYALANRLRVFVTLTFANPVVDEKVVNRRRNSLMAKLRKQHGGRFPAIFVPEQHSSGAWHLHGLVPLGVVGRLFAAWKCGDIDIQLLDSRRDIVSVVHYMSKGFVERAGSGQRRYYAARGFKPYPEIMIIDSEGAALSELNSRLGQPHSSLYRLPHNPNIAVASWDLPL